MNVAEKQLIKKLEINITKKKKDFLAKLGYVKLEDVKMFLVDTTKVKYVMSVLLKMNPHLVVNC